MPELTPFGDTFFDASVRAIVAASFLNRPSGGWVASEVAVTWADQRFFDPGLCDFARLVFDEADLRDFDLAGIKIG